MDELNGKKKNVGLIVFCVFLILCVLGLGGYIVYDKYIKKEEKVVVKKEKCEVCKTNENNYIRMINDTKEDISYNIYAIKYDSAVVSYGGELYLVNGMNNDKFAFEFDSYFEDCLKKMELKDNEYKCDLYKISGEKKEEDDGDEYYDILKLDVKEKDVAAVNISHASEFSDVTSHIFIIYNDGSVLLSSNNSEVRESLRKNAEMSVFEKYKVKYVNEYCYKQREHYGCDPGYKLTLQDGSEKTVTSLD